eukprot:2223972-Pyramimonas_sp.AAC.1
MDGLPQDQPDMRTRARGHQGHGGLALDRASTAGQARRPEVGHPRGAEGRGRARAAAACTGQERGR